MADSKRLQIQKKLTELLQTITPANGYQFDLSGTGEDRKVYRGRGVISDEEPLPMVNILESFNPDRDPFEVGGHERRHQTDSWVLQLQGWAADDKDNPTDPAHNLMADVKKCLARIITEDDPSFLLEGLVADAAIEPGTVRPPDENSSRAFFWLRIRLNVDENVGDPYDIT